MLSLHRSLGLWFGGAVLLAAFCAAIPTVRAQLDTVSPATSPGEAARMFGALLARSADAPYGLQRAVVSRRDFDQLGAGGIAVLQTELARDAKYPDFDASRPRKEGDQTVVDVQPSNRPAALPVVCLQESPGAWKVDVVATFAKRRHLQPGVFQSEILNLTGVALPGLPNADRFDVQQQICQGNLHQLGMAIAQYTQDYDERFPRAANWTDAVQPYARGERVFWCPATKGGKWGYALNSTFSSVYREQVESLNARGQVPVIYETSILGPNVSGTGADLQRRHSNQPNAPLGRRNSLFLVSDGQVFSDGVGLVERPVPLVFSPRLRPARVPLPVDRLAPPPALAP